MGMTDTAPCGGDAAAITGWLAFAATPAFGAMALYTGRFGDMICSMMPQASPLGGMTAMYVLMSIIHAGPWLGLVAHWIARWVTRFWPARFKVALP
jgi:hypothetical protein